MCKAKKVLLKGGIVILLFLAFECAVNGQKDKIIQSDDFYYYQNKKYKIQDLSAIVFQKPDAAVPYMRGKRKYDNSRTLGIVAGSSIGLGLISFSLITEPDGVAGILLSLGPNLFFKLMGTTFTGVGVICGISALINRQNGIDLMQKGLVVFNKTDKSMSYCSGLHLGLTGQGVGLIYSF